MRVGEGDLLLGARDRGRPGAAPAAPTASPAVPQAAQHPPRCLPPPPLLSPQPRLPPAHRRAACLRRHLPLPNALQPPLPGRLPLLRCKTAPLPLLAGTSPSEAACKRLSTRSRHHRPSCGIITRTGCSVAPCGLCNAEIGGLDWLPASNETMHSETARAGMPVTRVADVNHLGHMSVIFRIAPFEALRHPMQSVRTWQCGPAGSPRTAGAALLQWLQAQQPAAAGCRCPQAVRPLGESDRGPGARILRAGHRTCCHHPLSHLQRAPLRHHLLNDASLSPHSSRLASC